MRKLYGHQNIPKLSLSDSVVVCVCVSHGELWGAGGGVEWWLGVTVCSVCATVEQVYSTQMTV
jgi:hypothetical protein